MAEPNENVKTQRQPHDLTSPATVKQICETVVDNDQWLQKWNIPAVALLKDIRNASAQELASPEFSKRLWTDDNRLASSPDGICMKRVVENRELAEWIGKTAKTSLQARGPDRVNALEKIYDDLRDRVKLLVADKTPWSRILRVMAALFPEDYSRVVTVYRLRRVAQAMFGKLSEVERESPTRLNERILSRLTEILGAINNSPEQLALRSQLVWTLWKYIDGQTSQCQQKSMKTESS